MLYSLFSVLFITSCGWLLPNMENMSSLTKWRTWLSDKLAYGNGRGESDLCFVPLIYPGMLFICFFFFSFLL